MNDCSSTIEDNDIFVLIRALELAVRDLAFLAESTSLKIEVFGLEDSLVDFVKTDKAVSVFDKL